MRHYLSVFITLACAVTTSVQAIAASTVPLDSVIATTLSANPELRAADREIDAARARVSQARALEAPSLSYSMGKLGTPVSSEEYDASLRLSQALPAFGQRGRAARLAELDVEIARTRRSSLALRLTGETTRAYRQLQADVRTVQALEKLRPMAADAEGLTRIRMESAGARYLDVLRARSERARLENDLFEARRSLREHQLALIRLTHLPMDAEILPADSLHVGASSDSLTAVLDQALRTRPRLMGARSEVEREQASVSVATNGRVPAIELSGGWDRVAGSSKPGWGGEVSVSLPFFPWTDRKSRITEARASVSGAEARLQAATREVETLVRSAYEASSAAEQQARTFESVLLADAEDAIRAAIQNYRSGQIDSFELFETLRTYRTIQIEHIRALLNYELARTDLETAE